MKYTLNEMLDNTHYPQPGCPLFDYQERKSPNIPNIIRAVDYIRNFQKKFDLGYYTFSNPSVLIFLEDIEPLDESYGTPANMMKAIDIVHQALSEHKELLGMIEGMDIQSVVSPW